MIRRLITLLITATLVLFGLALLWPQKAEQIAVNILKGFAVIQETRLPLPGERPQVLRIVDPEKISTAIREETSTLAGLFRTRHEQGGALAIEDIIDETNKQRIREGFPPLRTNELLIESAELKTKDMINLQYFEHKSPTGVSVSDLGGKVGYDYIMMGENLALGNFEDAADLVQAWMDSPGHRANILNTMYQEIGVYAMRGTYEGREVWFAVQHFGASRGACPAIDKSLKREIDAMNAQLGIQESQIEALKRELEGMNAGDPGYNEKVDQFNGMVNGYNQILIISKQKIGEYNAQVSKFNSCLVKYQK